MKVCLKVTAILLTVAVLCSCVLFKKAECVSTSSKSFVVMNADTFDVLAFKNAYQKLSMASTTKLMTALILAEQNTPKKTVTTTREMVTVEGSSMGLQIGDTVSHYDLLVGMLLPSGNDAANTAAISVAGSIDRFAELMNKKADEIGMKSSNFVTPSGLDAQDHYSTAYDMALLAVYALKNDTIREICSKEKITVTFGNPPYQRTLYNHNKLLGRYEGCIGMKTGFTKKSGRCLVSAAEKNGCRVVAVTLNDPDDWNDHERLLDFGFSSIETVDITDNQSILNVDVVGGTKDILLLGSPRCTVGGTRDLVNKVKIIHKTKPFVYAPIKAGDTVGFTEYYYNGRLLKQTEIYALESIDKAVYRENFSKRFYKNFKTIFKQFV